MVRRIASLITGPSDAWLAVRVIGWACVLPALKHLVPVKSLASVMHLAPRTSPRNPARRDPVLEVRIVTFARWAARLMRWKSGGNCLERGLIAYRYLGAAGASPTLVVGLGRGERGGIIGHAWVMLDGRPAGESESAIAEYTPVFSFAPDGSLLAEPAPPASAR